MAGNPSISLDDEQASSYVGNWIGQLGLSRIWLDEVFVAQKHSLQMV
jgi:hypothetical protein